MHLVLAVAVRNLKIATAQERSLDIVDTRYKINKD
jgi:hypothetical protein